MAKKTPETVGQRIKRYREEKGMSQNALAVETGTNGIRRVELHGYQNDSSQALGAVTDAAVRAAIQSAK